MPESKNGKGSLYEFAVLYHPKQTKDQAERNEWPKSTQVVPLTTILAGSEAEVSILAGRAIPEEHLAHLDDVQILVRSFLE